MTTWAITGDDRHLAYENACELHGLLTDALNELSAKGTNVDLDDIAFVIESDADRMLGENGRRIYGRDDKRLAFTGEQVLAMASVLGDLLPDLALHARAATLAWEARQDAARRAAAAKRN